MIKRIRNVSLSVKLPALFAVLAVLAVAATSVLTMQTVQSKLEEAAAEAAISARDSRLAALNNWRDQIAGRIETDRISPTVRQALATLSGNAASAPAEGAIQTPSAASLASDAEGFLEAIRAQGGLKDILLVDADGNVLFSAGNAGLPENVLAGQWSGSNLAEALAASAARPAEVVFSDLAKLPGGEGIGGFVVGSVQDAAGGQAGFIVAEFTPESIDEVTHAATGLGETGAAFLVGPDNLLRSNVPSSDGAALVDESESDGVAAALDGKSGIERFEDSSGVVKLSAYAPFEIAGSTWALIVQHDLTGSAAALHDVLQKLLLATLATAAVIAALGFAISRGITTPLRRLSEDIRQVATGDYSAEIAATGDGDEIGGVARSVNALREDLSSRQAEIVDQASLLDAISRSQGVIEFDSTGRILRANANLLAMTGYDGNELIGAHHSMLAEAGATDTPEYRRFWDALRAGQGQGGTFKRVGKGGRVVYMQGCYSPVYNSSGAVVRVVKVVADVTKAETARLEEIAQRTEIVVGQLGGALSQLADGDLAFRLNQTFPGEYEALRLNFNDAIGKLEGTLASVMVGAESIKNEATHVTQAAADLSHRTESQAAALEETAASLEELTASVRTAAKSAEQANTDVAAAKKNAEESGRIVRDAISAMSEIETSSEHISQIIGVIDDIAFQTNLLALNAGVEAARAGEAGRGFAVVASEVRALAQRSSDAAKEIKALISTSSQHVDRGVDLVRETGRSLETIVHAVTGITTLVSEIAHSSREQSVGLSEINSAVSQLDQVTQQNAAMVEESTAASHAMKSEAEALAQLVAQFKAGLTQTAQTHETAHRAAAVKKRPGPKFGVSAAAEKAPRMAAPIRKAVVNGSASVEDWQEF